MANNVDKAVYSNTPDDDDDYEVTLESPEAVMAVDPEAIEIEQEDGSVIIQFGDEDPGDIGHDENLAEYLPDDEMQRVSEKLLSHYDADIRSREDWWRAYRDGLDLLGLKIEEKTDPWPGAAGMFHPVLSESVVRFQANSIMEIFPPQGPVKSKIIGEVTDEKSKQSRRVAHDMNYALTERVAGYREEFEQLLFNLPLAGSAFKKVFWSSEKNNICIEYIPADDLIVPYGASNLRDCERICHRMKRTKNELRKAQVSGMYRDIDLEEPAADYTEVEEKQDEIAGEQAILESDDRYTILEFHVNLDLKGFEHTDDGGDETGIGLPYIVTLVKGSGEILSIYRNWEEEDPEFKRLDYFVHYKYLPGFGFYGIGLIHLIGGLAKTATLTLRQLTDAGTLSNLPAGFKVRGMRVKGDDTPLRPGELRDVDVPGQSIRDGIFMLPYKEPSTVLYQLLGDVVNEARNLASVPDLKVSDMSNEAPVGTTLAIIERSMKVLSAVQARIHASLKNELQLVSRTIRDFFPEEYEYEIEDEGATRTRDYDGRVDIVPVSNPNSATMAQRIMQHQAALQLSAQAPHLYDQKKLHRNMLEALGYEDADDLIPLEDEMDPKDPVTENMDALNMEPMKAFMYQDHEAHIQTHMAMAQDPRILELMQNHPNAQGVQAHMAAHIAEHLGFAYRSKIEKAMGTTLPPPDQPLPPEVEVELSKLVAEASDQVLKQGQQEAAQREAEEKAQDPVVQMQAEELRIKAAEVERKTKADELRHMAEMQKLAAQQKEAGAEIGADILEALIDAYSKNKELSVKQVIEGAKIGSDLAREAGRDYAQKNSKGDKSGE